MVLNSQNIFILLTTLVFSVFSGELKFYQSLTEDSIISNLQGNNLLFGLEIRKFVDEKFDEAKLCLKIELNDKALYQSFTLKCVLDKIKELRQKNLPEVNTIIDLYNYSESPSVKADDVYGHLINFKAKNLFTSLITESEDKIESVYSSLVALKILGNIYPKNSKDNKELQEKITTEIESLLSALDNKFNLLNDNSKIGLFSDSNYHSFELNNLAVEALIIIESNKDLKSIKSFGKINFYLSAINNYFNEYKHSAVTLDNIFYLLSTQRILNRWPIVSIDSKSLYSDDSEIVLTATDNFDNDVMKDFDITVNYSLENEPKKEESKEDYKLDSTDLVDLDDEEQDKPKESSDSNLQEANNSSGSLKLKINKSGIYSFSVSFTNKATKYQGITSFSKFINKNEKPKIQYLKFSISGGKDDSKETKLEFPKRSFKNFKGNQSSVLTVKIKLSIDKKPEQLFFRLRHNELGRTATGCVSKYDQINQYHIIKFDVSDHVSNYN